MPHWNNALEDPDRNIGRYSSIRGPLVGDHGRDGGGGEEAGEERPTQGHLSQTAAGLKADNEISTTG